MWIRDFLENELGPDRWNSRQESESLRVKIALLTAVLLDVIHLALCTMVPAMCIH